jgi:TPR repeat protein
MAEKTARSRRLAAFVAAGALLIIGSRALAGAYEDGEKAYWAHDYATALQLLKPLAEQGDTRAERMLGFMYLNGFGVAQDKAMALNWVLRAAVNGNASAQTTAGHAYFEGWGRAPDLGQSVKWYRRAADQGDPEGQAQLGAMLENGFGAPQDYVEAMKWSILAAKRYPDSETESRRLAAVNRDRQAEHLDSGQIAEAQRRAREWTPTPFRKTDADADLEAGLALARGDNAEAARLFQPLAERGVIEAQEMLGAMYGAGVGVPADAAQSVKWFRLAAAQGAPGGAFGLAGHYEEGTGVPRDEVRAYMWYQIAATSGDAYAAEFAESRDKLAARLTPAQISQAQSQAATCKASRYRDCG